MTDVPINLRPDAFAGTAEAYARYRPPYPRSMLADLLERAAVGSGLLVDLATGPGRIVLDLAGSFERAIAIDLEPDMIEVGRARAGARGIANVEWRVGRAEDLALAPSSVDLVTIGEAFHRLEQSTVARRAIGWLRPGGCLATLGIDGRFSGDAAWQISLREVRDRWLTHAFPEGFGLWVPSAGEGQLRRERVLREAGFMDVEGHDYDEIAEYDIDTIIGYLLSTSVCSRKALGEDFDAFEAELQAALSPHAMTGYAEVLHWGYTLARKPG